MTPCGAPESRQPTLACWAAGLRGVGSSSLPLDRPSAAVGADETAYKLNCL